MKENKGGPPKRLCKRAVDFVGIKRFERIHTPNLAVHTCMHGMMEHEKEVGLIFWNTKKEKDTRQAC